MQNMSDLKCFLTMKRFLNILILALAVSCTQKPDVDDHLMPELGKLEVTPQTYSAHAECAVSNPKAIENATAELVDADGSIEQLTATLSGTLLSVDIDRLQSGSSYSISFIVSSGEYSVSSGEQGFRTQQGPKAIYPVDENFEAYLLEHHDSDHNGILTTDEAKRITEIELRTDNIRSIDEIRYMPNLFYLDVWNYEGTQGQLTGIDLSGCPNLIRLNCDRNRIESLDLSHCPYLEYLYCGFNSISEIDLSQNPELLELNIETNLLSSIDISAQKKLQTLNIGTNRAIRSISVPCPEKLLNFSIGDTRITEFDLSTMPKLQVYGGNNLPLDFVPDFSSHPHMREIHICTTGGASWISDPHYTCQFEELESINLCAYPLDTIDFSKNTRLRMLWISIANNLEEIDLSAAPDMEVLEFSDCEKLKRIYVHPDVVIENLHTLRGSCKAEILHKN